MTWNPDKGFYISTIQLNSPWESELEKLETRIGEHINKACIVNRNFDDSLTWLSFKSHDGDPYTKPALKGKGEVPGDFKWTPAYENNPILKSVINWFPVEKTRVRLARQNPETKLDLHFDWDNLRFDFEQEQQIVRIWVQLSDTESYYRLTNGIDDVCVSLKRGQFIILNVDSVLHATFNRDSKPRENLIIHAKTNQWIRCLPDLFPYPKVLDPRTDDPQ